MSTAKPARQIAPKGTPLAECMRDYFMRYLSLDDERRDDQSYLNERRRKIDFLVRDLRRPTSIPKRYRMTERTLLFCFERGVVRYPNYVFLFGMCLSFQDYSVLEMEKLPVEVYDLADFIYNRHTTLQEASIELDLEIHQMVKILIGQLPICHALSRDTASFVKQIEASVKAQEEADLQGSGDDNEVVGQHDYLSGNYPNDFDPDELHGLDFSQD